MKKSVALPYTDVIDWLRRLPPEAVVYPSYASRPVVFSDRCVVANYIQQTQPGTFVRMGFIASTDGVDYVVDATLRHMIRAWDRYDERQTGVELTARHALELVEHLLPEA